MIFHFFYIYISSTIVKCMVAKGFSCLHFELHAFCQEAQTAGCILKARSLGISCLLYGCISCPKHIFVWCSCLIWVLSVIYVGGFWFVLFHYQGRAVDLFISVWRWIFLLIGRLTHWPLTPLCASFPCVLLSATPLGEFSGVYLITDWLVFLFLILFCSSWPLDGFNITIHIIKHN